LKVPGPSESTNIQYSLINIDTHVKSQK